MVPSIDNPRWRGILDGTVAHQFRSVPAGLMVARLKRQLADDRSAENRDKCVREMRAFFEKYERVTADDLAAIFG